jgi:hypothetical protein
LDQIYYEKVLNRIIQGRLRIRLGDLVLFIYEPTKEILEESYEIYDAAYEKAYFAGSYVEQEIIELLVSFDLWSPLDDRGAKDLEEKVEDLKVEAFKNSYSKKTLISIKRHIRQVEEQVAKLKYKRRQLDNISCKGLANFAKQSWTISQTAKLEDGSLAHHVIPLPKLMSFYTDNEISSEVFRKIARTDPWRSMWVSCVKQGNAFGMSSSSLDRHKLALVGYSTMYDNVYENPEAPDQKVIDDDDCLDGWFILQKRQRDKDKKKREADKLLSNPKIANSQEVFLMAKDGDHAKEIMSLNNPHGTQVINQRNKEIDDAGQIHFKNLSDVKQDRQMAATQAGISQLKNVAR